MGVDNIQLFPVSARTSEGVQALKDAIEADCQTTVQEIIEHSAKLKMRDIATSALSQIDLYRTALKMPAREFDAMFKELNEFFAEIKQEAAEFAESFRSNPRMLEAHMNNIKNRLSAKVSDMFGIEYHYTISSVDFFRGGEVAHAQGREYLCGNPQGERPEPPGAQACAPETRTGGRIDNTSTNIKISRYTFFGVYGSFL